MGRSNMAGYNQDDIEEMKIRDGPTPHGIVRLCCENIAVTTVWTM